MAAFARAGELIERAEPSPTVAHVASRLAINTMLRGQYDETIALCDRALADRRASSAWRTSAATS